MHEHPIPDRHEAIRLAVYHALADTGRLPELGDLVELAGGESQLRESIEHLAGERAWALGADGEIVLAHPFATRSFGYSVMSATTLWWGGCCWDSFAIAHLVPTAAPVVVATTCPACDRALAWSVDTSRPPTGPERAHFLVPAHEVWDDVIHTCSHQQLFCDDRCIDTWLERTGRTEGYRMDLARLWRLASGWYEGRLGAGYRRREPAAAADYFAAAGLTGSFWGLPDDRSTTAEPIRPGR